MSPAKTAKGENTFGSFAIGVAVGVGAALLFGTDEGKKLANSLFDKLPEKIKNLTDTTDYPTESTIYDLPSTPESTPHHYTYHEAPPPPAPHVIPTPPSLRVS